MTIPKYKAGLEAWGFQIRPGGALGFAGIMTETNTADRTYTFPDKSGTVAMLSDVVAGGMSNPMTTLGDFIYAGAGGTPTRLAGNITTAKRFLTQTGNGTISAAPVLGSIVSADIAAALATPGAIGSTTPNTGAFTSLTATAGLWSTTGIFSSVIQATGAISTGSLFYGSGAQLTGPLSATNGTFSGDINYAYVQDVVRTLWAGSFGGAVQLQADSATVSRWARIGIVSSVNVWQGGMTINNDCSATFSGVINPSNGLMDTQTGASWVSQMTDTSVLVKGNVTASSYRAYIQSTTTGSTNHTFTLGNLGNAQFGFYGYLNSRTANGTDFSCFMDTAGNWNTSGQCSSTQFNGSGAGLTGSAPSLTVGACSGNSAGNAATATQLKDGNGVATTFSWAGNGGQPTWLWGTSAEGNTQLWNPSNFSVNYASTVGISTNRTDNVWYQAMWATSGGTTCYSTAAVMINSSGYGGILFGSNWAIYGNATYGLYSNTGLNAAGGLWDSGNRVYSAANPQTTIGGLSILGSSSTWTGISGWMKFSNGLIIQWGTVYQGGVITFPIAFPSYIFSLQDTWQLNTSWSPAAWSVSKTGFTCGTSSGNYMSWMAMGY